jgi:hypothetical protein
MVVITLGVEDAVAVEAYRLVKECSSSLPVVAVAGLNPLDEAPEEVTSVIHRSELNRDQLEVVYERHVRRTLQLAIEETEAFFDTYKTVPGG